MKFRNLFFSIIAVAFLSSGIAFDRSLSDGSRAPEIETTEGINVGYDANSEKKTKIVSFWSPKNAASRIAVRDLQGAYASDPGVDFISICTDSDETLMRQVMHIEGIDPQSNYAYSEIAPRVFKDYGVENVPASYMISPEGLLKKL